MVKIHRENYKEQEVQRAHREGGKGGEKRMHTDGEDPQNESRGGEVPPGTCNTANLLSTATRHMSLESAGRSTDRPQRKGSGHGTVVVQHQGNPPNKLIRVQYVLQLACSALQYLQNPETQEIRTAGRDTQ